MIFKVHKRKKHMNVNKRHSTSNKINQQDEEEWKPKVT